MKMISDGTVTTIMPCMDTMLQSRPLGVTASSAYSGINGALINMALYTPGITITLIAVALMSEKILGRLLRGSRDLRGLQGH